MIQQIVVFLFFTSFLNSLPFRSGIFRTRRFWYGRLRHDSLVRKQVDLSFERTTIKIFKNVSALKIVLNPFPSEMNKKKSTSQKSRKNQQQQIATTTKTVGNNKNIEFTIASAACTGIVPTRCKTMPKQFSWFWIVAANRRQVRTSENKFKLWVNFHLHISGTSTQERCDRVRSTEMKSRSDRQIIFALSFFEPK